MIGLSLNSHARELAIYLAENRRTWWQGHLGDWPQTKTPPRYEAHGNLEILRFHPDEQITRSNLRHEEVSIAIHVPLGIKKENSKQ